MEKIFTDHINNEQVAREKLSDKIDNIRDNHLAHLSLDVGEVKLVVVEVKNDVAWLKRFFWIVVTASLGSFITAVWQVVQK